MRLQFFLPLLYSYAWDYVQTGSSLELKNHPDLPVCTSEDFYVLNILPYPLKHWFTMDLTDSILSFFEVKHLDSLKNYFATI